MAIEKKLIHFGKLADFEAQLTAGNILDYSIVFIQDAKKIWTHGTYYDCSEGGASEGTSNYYITEFTYYDFYNAASENGQLQISANDATGLIDSIEMGSRILIPYGDTVSGYAIMLGENDSGEVYVTVYSTRDVITALFFENDIRQGNNLTFDNDVTISNAMVYEADTASRPNTLAVRDSSGAIETNGIIDDQGNWWVTPTSSNESRASADYQFQSKIQDLDEIREGASKGATAVQPSDLPTKVSQLDNDSKFVDEQFARENFIGRSEDLSGMEVARIDQFLTPYGSLLYAFPDTANGDEDDVLLSRGSVKTINGESILGEGDLTIEGGAKIYEWFYDGEFESVTLSQEEYDNIVEADLVIVKLGMFSFTVSKTDKEFAEATGECVLVGQFDFQGSKMYIQIVISIATKLATITIEEQAIPTKTSELENDSNFVSSDNLKTINGESILGSGDITISGGGSSGGSGAYPEVDGSIYKQEDMLGNWYIVDELMPNTFYVFPECGILDIYAFGPETVGVANEYLFQFTSGNEATTLSLPGDLKWTEELTIEPNMIYQVSILKGLASVLSWDNAPEIAMISFNCMVDNLQAEAGMTWNEWVNSSYNNGKYGPDGEQIIRNGDSYVTYQGSCVNRTDAIIPNAFYNTEPL